MPCFSDNFPSTAGCSSRSWQCFHCAEVQRVLARGGETQTAHDNLDHDDDGIVGECEEQFDYSEH